MQLRRKYIFTQISYDPWGRIRQIDDSRQIYRRHSFSIYCIKHIKLGFGQVSSNLEAKASINEAKVKNEEAIVTVQSFEITTAGSSDDTKNAQIEKNCEIVEAEQAEITVTVKIPNRKRYADIDILQTVEPEGEKGYCDYQLVLC